MPSMLVFLSLMIVLWLYKNVSFLLGGWMIIRGKVFRVCNLLGDGSEKNVFAQCVYRDRNDIANWGTR